MVVDTKTAEFQKRVVIDYLESLIKKVQLEDFRSTASPRSLGYSQRLEQLYVRLENCMGTWSL